MKRKYRLEEVATVRPGDKVLRRRTKNPGALQAVSRNVNRLLRRRHPKQSETR